MMLKYCTLTFALLILVTQNVCAIDLLGELNKVLSTNQSATLTTTLSQDQMVGALKEALSNGVQHAVAQLGRTNGFLTNTAVRIPMPDKLQAAEKALRSMKQDKLADDFIATMNHAAEQAVPFAINIFADSLQHISIADAKSILTGTTNAATQYFRRTTETNLYTKFLPIVSSATQSNRVAVAYKNLIGKAQQGTLGSLGGLTDPNSALGGLLNKGGEYLGKDAIDLDAYVTQKALNGLFKMVAEEERKIRENPAARTSDLLQKVFGAVKK